MGETYRQMKKRHQDEFNSFPCFFAFNKEQFIKGMKELGAKSAFELRQGIAGMFYRRADEPELCEMSERHHNEYNVDKTALICCAIMCIMYL